MSKFALQFESEPRYNPRIRQEIRIAWRQESRSDSESESARNRNLDWNLELKQTPIWRSNGVGFQIGIAVNFQIGLIPRIAFEVRSEVNPQRLYVRIANTVVSNLTRIGLGVESGSESEIDTELNLDSKSPQRAQTMMRF